MNASKNGLCNLSSSPPLGERVGVRWPEFALISVLVIFQSSFVSAINSEML
jgi:hypothetical protein